MSSTDNHVKADTAVHIPALQVVASASTSADQSPTLKRGATFADTGMHITVKELTYTVDSAHEKGKKLALLQDVTGYFMPKQMTALMGPSGSGKTTLLDLLAGRKTVGETQGSILFAGHKASQQFLRRYTGYVEQFDTLLPILTVEEMLLYTAELKRPLSEPLSEKKAAVEDLLEKLALTTCRNVKIGSALSKGISGGQAKRTNIGIALITNPRVLFLDEPTSGLDSFTSNEVITVVKNLVGEGVTVVATIHSPTAYAFSLFDSLMMLVRGRTVYFGPTGAPAITFVKDECAKLNTRDHPILNEAEWLVDLFTEADRQGRASSYADLYAASSHAAKALGRVEELQNGSSELPARVRDELDVKSETVTPWWWGLRTMIKYRTTHNYRDPAFLGPRLGDKLFMGLLIMTLYLGVGNNWVPSNYINMAAVLFMWNTMPAFGAAAYVPTLVLERGLFVRERSDGLYRVFTYLAAKMFDELCITLFSSAAIAAIVFYGVQLQGNFALFWLVYYMTLCCGIVLAYFVAAIAPSMDAANAMLPVYVSTLLFFAGFLFTFDKMPPWWKWYSYINFMRYGWTATMVNHFEKQNPMWVGGETLLEYYGIAGQSKWANFGYLSCFFVFFTFCAWFVLSFKRYAVR